MIKPIGAACNLDCTYCYYLHKSNLLHHPSSTKMSDEVLELLIKQYISTNDHEQIVFSWQGGEPTLLGISFFEKVVRLQTKHNPMGKKIANTLQTNGTLLNDSWAAFLKEHDFLVGLSVDGPEKIHNKYRYDKDGNGSFAKMMQGYEHLCQHNVAFTTLTTVNNYNVKKPLEVYHFLTHELGSNYVQFNPCVELKSYAQIAPHCWEKSSLPRKNIKKSSNELSTSNDIKSFVTDWSVDSSDWGDFLCAIFDDWLKHDLGRVLVNWFETAVAQTMNLPAQLCTTGELCGKGVAIEHDGSLYSCDHYVNTEYCLGNIKDKTLKDMVFSRKQQQFAFKKQRALSIDCLHCPHGSLCWGQCPRHRFVQIPNSEHGLNYLCTGFKQFYGHAKPTIKNIATHAMAVLS